jgi:hypothetical protein
VERSGGVRRGLDWQRGLTVWALAGRHPEPRFDRKVLEHELPARPAGERRARTAARRWWRAQGHGQAISAAGGNVKQSGRDPGPPAARRARGEMPRELSAAEAEEIEKLGGAG